MRRTLTGLAATLALAGSVTAGIAGAAHASPRSLSGTSFDRAVHEVDETMDWCNGMGCAEHQHTRATLFITYTYVEDEDGNLVARPTGAHISGTTRTWTDLKLAGFHA